MQLGPVHFNLEISVADLLVICGAALVGTRTVVGWLKRNLIDRLELHEAALVKAGWLRKNRQGEVYVPEHASRP